MAVQADGVVATSFGGTNNYLWDNTNLKIYTEGAFQCRCTNFEVNVRCRQTRENHLTTVTFSGCDYRNLDEQ